MTSFILKRFGLVTLTAACLALNLISCTGNEMGDYLPKELTDLEFIDSDPMIKSIRRILVPGSRYPYNASIIDDGDGYFLAFRHVVTDRKHRDAAETQVRVARLDKNFLAKGKVRILKTNSILPEDPRLFRVGDEVYLAYNATEVDTFPRRTMYLAKLLDLEQEDGPLNAIEYRLPYHEESDQKNWVPFVHDNNIYLSYDINPHHLLHFDPNAGRIMELPFSSSADFNWPYGQIRGGTPAIRWGNEYLAFFHSSFYSGGLRWYVMGAYTFEATPPFRLLRISKAPIMSTDFYTTKIQPIVNKTNRVLFPSGLTIKDGIIRVSYGENDSSVKILELSELEFEKTLTNVISK